MFGISYHLNQRESKKTEKQKLFDHFVESAEGYTYRKCHIKGI